MLCWYGGGVDGVYYDEGDSGIVVVVVVVVVVVQNIVVLVQMLLVLLVRSREKVVLWLKTDLIVGRGILL
ncbi:hypothetical protein Pcinc_023528 [Petrolisthes cinctipes]|uniref:Transmembrane protein n=1 Tax=Petrolisthes cinctipes TaxID=88211 RepID=A0AAE1FBW5_PETCI|nr:hypothetical protein Pcinc_023528 [Petrolisthes cinctipes]